MNYKVGIWGQFGGRGKIADGQAVKTILLSKELEKRYGRDHLCIANTNNWRKNPFRMIWRSIYLVAKSRHVLVLPADNGFKVFIPILICLNKIFKKDLIYIVIGGFLPQLLKRAPKFKRYLDYFSVIYVETESLKNDLDGLGVQKVSVLHNMKRLDCRTPSEIRLYDQENIKLCVFSRITKEKGVEDAIAAVNIANQVLGNQFITLDLYGIIPNTYKDRFDELMKQNAAIATYKGIVDYDKTVDVLKEYYAMLFPTYYHGEGFPGNLIDAYNAGIPVIATNWLYTEDIVKNERNGILVEPKNVSQLSKAILKLYQDRQLAYIMSLNNLKDAKMYHPDVALQELYRKLD